MARNAPRGKTAKRDWYVELSQELISSMQMLIRYPVGGDWQAPWWGMSGAPHNGLTDRNYSGFNVILLRLTGRDDPRWFTFDQAKQAVGYKRNPKWKGKADTFKGIRKWLWKGEDDDPNHGVRKGEKGRHVFFWRFIRKYVDSFTGKAVRKPTKEQIANHEVRCTANIPMIKVYVVFNADQIEGLPAIPVPEVDPTQKYASAQALLDILGVTVNHKAGGNTAAYNKASDEIVMPAPGQFDSVEEYWATLMHEVIHWTGHTTRLNRSLKGRFDEDAYAMEELVAEFGAAFLCTHLGIEGNLQHPQYLAHWVKRLQSDKYAAFTASTMAQKAVDFILNGGMLEEEDEKTSDVDPSEATPAATPAAKAA